MQRKQTKLMASSCQIRKLRPESKIIDIICQGRGIISFCSVRGHVMDSQNQEGAWGCLGYWILEICYTFPPSSIAFAHHLLTMLHHLGLPCILQTCPDYSHCRAFGLAALHVWDTAP